MNTFFLIVLGQIISLFGNAALRFALPLYLLRQTGSAALYGGVTALAMLPALAGMLTGGALADRCRKARLMALLDLVTAGISAAAAAGLPHLPLLPLILTVLGSLYAIQGLYQPVVRACLPLLLNGTQLLRGNAVIQLVDTVDELLGPLLGAVLLEHLGIRGLLALCGGCFALSAGMELCLRIPQDVPRDTKLSVRSLWTDLRESARFLTGQAAVLRLAAAMAAVNLLEVPAITVGVPVLVVQTLQKSDASLGLVQAVLSAGGILGGVLAGTVFVRHPIRSGTSLLLALSGVCAALGFALRVPTLQFGSILVLGAVFMTVAALFNVWFFAQLQVLVPQAQLGKTTACISVLACLTQPIGQAAYGSAFQHWAAHPADVLLAAGGAFGAGSLAAANAPYRLTHQKRSRCCSPFYGMLTPTALPGRGSFRPALPPHGCGSPQRIRSRPCPPHQSSARRLRYPRLLRQGLPRRTAAKGGQRHLPAPPQCPSCPLPRQRPPCPPRAPLPQRPAYRRSLRRCGCASPQGSCYTPAHRR